MHDIILTGGSGFLGQAIQQALGNKNIVTVGRSDASVVCDLRDSVPTLQQSDVVIHAAGKAHVHPRSALEKQEFFDVNVTGTANLLKALEINLPKAFVFISSVAVYGVERGNSLTEEAPLHATDAYGKSKIEAEALIREWCNRNNVIYAILRLPLLAGTNPPGNLGAMIKAINNGYYFDIAGGKARKSMVLASDVAKVLLRAAEVGGIYNLTDGKHPSFFELSQLISRQLNKGKIRNMPLVLAKLISLTGDLLGSKAPINSNKLRKITNDLTFSDQKARELLGWSPTPVLEGFRI